MRVRGRGGGHANLRATGAREDGAHDIAPLEVHVVRDRPPNGRRIPHRRRVEQTRLRGAHVPEYTESQARADGSRSEGVAKAHHAITESHVIYSIT